MAKNCCICDAKIGAFDKPKALTPETPDLVLCTECGEKLSLAQKTDIDPENKNVLAHQEKATDDLVNRLVSGQLDPNVAMVLDVIPALAKKKEQAAAQRAVSEEAERRYREERDETIVTTGYAIEGRSITAYHGVISTDSIIGTGIASELKASVSDLLGETSEAFKKKLESAKSEAYSELLKKAILAGGNAIIGVSYDVYVVGSMLGVSVTGTSVTIV